jgi:hypothetical protein
VKHGARDGRTTVRVAGIDDWQKGTTYGTVIVDLERRQVVDVLADRSADATAEWLRAHPEVEMVSRDRAGLYACGARRGAPQARQIADRFQAMHAAMDIDGPTYAHAILSTAELVAALKKPAAIA